jgi:hypothetical protein
MISRHNSLVEKNMKFELKKKISYKTSIVKFKIQHLHFFFTFLKKEKKTVNKTTSKTPKTLHQQEKKKEMK